MYTKIHDNTLTTKFISYILSKFPTPLVSAYKKNHPVIKNKLYVYKNCLYKALATVKAEDNTKTPDSDIKTFRYIQPFIFGQNYPNLTSTFNNSSSDYNSVTHRFLGDYLRAIRDYCDLDLMPFYNCFDGSFLSSVNVQAQRYVDGETSDIISSISYTTEESPEGYNIIAIPIKPEQRYSIYIDAESGFDYCPIFYGRNTIIEDATNKLLRSQPQYNTSYKKCHRSNFNNPFIIEPIKLEEETLIQYTPTLRLIIKLPADNTSSIVVLEGDYKNIPIRVLNPTNQNSVKYNKPLIVKCPGSKESQAQDNLQDVIEENWTQYSDQKQGPLKLNWLNDGQSYAFTDTLPQYLLLNVISHSDSIDDNIKRVQEYVTSIEHQTIFGTYYKHSYTPGIWTESLRNYLFNLMLTNENVRPAVRLDINGYVDKLTEQNILRGQKI